jgi:LacI family transcriptional regulator
MREVAAAAGVSAKTVSRVMRNDRYVSAEVKQRVERAIVDLKYVPNVLARSFRPGMTPRSGRRPGCPTRSSRRSSDRWSMRGRGRGRLRHQPERRRREQRAGLEGLLGRRIAGLISTPISRDQSYLKHWQSRMALVFIDRSPGKIIADSVIEDDLGGAGRPPHASSSTAAAGRFHR